MKRFFGLFLIASILSTTAFADGDSTKLASPAKTNCTELVDELIVSSYKIGRLYISKIELAERSVLDVSYTQKEKMSYRNAQKRAAAIKSELLKNCIKN